MLFYRFSVLNVDMTNRPYFIGTIFSNQDYSGSNGKRYEINLRMFNRCVATDIIRLLCVIRYISIIIIYSSQSEFESSLVETEISVTGGVVGPTLAKSDTIIPINVTSVLGRPQVNVFLCNFLFLLAAKSY